MNQPSIYNRAGIRSVGQSIAAGMGAGQHPRISILGGAFHLVDAAGQRYQAPIRLFNGTTPMLMCIVVGANPNMSKQFYADAYEQGETGLPPTCFSDNGVGPSRNAGQKQARTCAECPHAAWGSAVSRVTGRPTKACADKKKLAVLVVGDTTGMCYELQVPPASLKALSVYQQMCGQTMVPDNSRPADVSDFVTGISFTPDRTGELQFQPLAWLGSVYFDGAKPVLQFDQAGNPLLAPDGGQSIADIIDHIWNSGQVDDLVGLKDQAAVLGPPALPFAPAPATAVAYAPSTQPEFVGGPPPAAYPGDPRSPVYATAGGFTHQAPPAAAPFPGPAAAPPARVETGYPAAPAGYPQPGQFVAPTAPAAPPNPFAGPGNMPVAQPVQAFPSTGQVIPPAAAQVAPGAPAQRGGRRAAGTRVSRPAPPPAPPAPAAAPAGPMPPLPDFLQRAQQQQPAAPAAPLPQQQPASLPVQAQPQPAESAPASNGMVDAPPPPADIAAQIRQAMVLGPSSQGS